MKRISRIWLPLLAVATMSITGCQETTETSAGTDPISALPPDTIGDHDEHDHAVHAHPSEGPHHGDLVELGNEEFHAEVVHDEVHATVTIYILDGSATRQVATDASELIINVTHDGNPMQFLVAAKPDDGDESGRSSRFVSEDKELAGHLDDRSSPRLVVKINGKSYRGEIAHSHDHAGHSHE